MGTSTITSYVESAAGAQGQRELGILARALARARLRSGDADGAAAALLAALDGAPSPDVEPVGFIETSGRLHRDLAVVYALQGRELKLDPGDAVDRVFDELVRLGVELAAIPLAQQVDVTADDAQRLLQIVRRDVGELLQIGVRTRETGGLLLDRLFGLLPIGEIDDQSQSPYVGTVGIKKRRA